MSEKDEILDKLKFEMEMKRMLSEIELLLKKILESSIDGKDEGVHKLQPALEKIKSDLEKLQKIVADKDQDALKKEVDVVKKFILSQSNKLKEIKDELEKSKKPPADNKDQGVKTEIEQIRKMLEDSQKGKLDDIQETLKKISDSLEKKPAPSPSPPSPDVSGLIKTGFEDVKKEFGENKILDALNKIKESVEKKPVPSAPAESPLKGDVEQIKRAVESLQNDEQKKFSIINMVFVILIFITLIVLIILLANGVIGRPEPTIKDLQNQMNELKDMIKKGKASLKTDGTAKKAEKKITAPRSYAGTKPPKDDCSTDDKPPFCFYLRNNETKSIVSGQVLIKLSNLTDESAFFELTLPNSKIYRMPDMRSGSRARFECKGETYFFDLMNINNSAARVKVSKRA